MEGCNTLLTWCDFVWGRQSGPLTWNWSDRFNFQIKSIWRQVAANVAFTWNQISESFSQWFRASYLVCLAGSGNKTSVLRLPTHLSTKKPIFLPTNPSFYQQTHLSTNKPIFLPTNPIFLPTKQTHLSTNKSSQVATHTYLLNPQNLNVWSTFWTNPTVGLYCSTFLPMYSISLPNLSSWIT